MLQEHAVDHPPLFYNKEKKNKNSSLSHSVADPGYLSRIRIFPSRVKKAPLPWSGSETKTFELG